MAVSDVRTRMGGYMGAWRRLGQMEAYQLPMALGGLIAIFTGIVASVFAVARGSGILGAFAQTVYLIGFGALAWIGHRVTADNVRNGAIAAGIAALGLLLVAGGSEGLLTGIIVLAGAAWAFTKSLG